jgi:hypothetical protein
MHQQGSGADETPGGKAAPQRVGNQGAAQALALMATIHRQAP